MSDAPAPYQLVLPSDDFDALKRVLDSIAGKGRPVNPDGQSLLRRVKRAVDAFNRTHRDPNGYPESLRVALPDLDALRAVKLGLEVMRYGAPDENRAQTARTSTLSEAIRAVLDAPVVDQLAALDRPIVLFAQPVKPNARRPVWPPLEEHRRLGEELDSASLKLTAHPERGLVGEEP